jgi:hypothetical protein
MCAGTVCFSRSPPKLNLSKLSSIAIKATKTFFFLNYALYHWFRKPKFRGPLSQASAFNHPNVLTSILVHIRKASGQRLGTFEQNGARFSLTTVKCPSLSSWLITFTCSSTLFLLLCLLHAVLPMRRFHRSTVKTLNSTTTNIPLRIDWPSPPNDLPSPKPAFTRKTSRTVPENRQGRKLCYQFLLQNVSHYSPSHCLLSLSVFRLKKVKGHWPRPLY